MTTSPATALTAAGSAAGTPGRLPRYRFVALAVVWSAYLIVFLSRLCVGPLAPFLKSAFHLDNAQIGGLTSATAVAYAPTLIFAGWLVDRIDVRRALLIGTAVTGVCIGLVALAPSYGTMLLLLGASGLGCGFIYPTAVKAIMLWFPPQERATAVGVNQSAVAEASRDRAAAAAVRLHRGQDRRLLAGLVGSCRIGGRLAGAPRLRAGAPPGVRRAAR
jgi:sugar phosphate permease